MKKIIIYTLLLCSLLAFNSCNNGNKNLNQNVKNEISRLKKEAKENPYEFDVHMTSMYNKELGFINRKDRVWQDILLEPISGVRGINYYSAYFFNYGDDIKLSNGMVYNTFVPIGKIVGMARVKDLHSLQFKMISNSEQYGEYAIVDWHIGNNVISDVFLTPLAYHAYQTRTNDECLVFVQFQSGQEYMNVIFCGNFFVCDIIEYSINYIKEGIAASSGSSGLGRFWHTL